LQNEAGQTEAEIREQQRKPRAHCPNATATKRVFSPAGIRSARKATSLK
jgi:hypothetical protein